MKVYHSIEDLSAVAEELGSKKVLLVHEDAFRFLGWEDRIAALPCRTVAFSGFSPNPRYEDVKKGLSLFQQEGCDGILAIGGGSTLDVAKCIKLFGRMDPDADLLAEPRTDTGIPLIAVPTTAGTGSDATRHAVIYREGVKQSISHLSVIPDRVILEPETLRTLPLYQKKCTLMDALCQAAESWWSRHATETSAAYSREALELILGSWRDYLAGYDRAVAGKMLWAAHLSGRAINLTATTAPHAMSYKLTSLYHLPHGHAVALCFPEVWEYMEAHPEEGADRAALEQALGELARLLTPADFRSMMAEMGLDRPRSRNREADLALLADSVNLERLSNNPVPLDRDTLYRMYERIVCL